MVVAAVMASTCGGGSGSPAAPSPVPPGVADFRGTWAGYANVLTCERNNFAFDTFCVHFEPAPRGARHIVKVELQQESVSVTGAITLDAMRSELFVAQVVGNEVRVTARHAFNGHPADIEWVLRRDDATTLRGTFNGSFMSAPGTARLTGELCMRAGTQHQRC